MPDVKAKMHQMRFPLGSTPDPAAWGNLQRSSQGSDTRVHTQKNPMGVWVDPPKKPANKSHQKTHLN